jgi:hypothetical protein
MPFQTTVYTQPAPAVAGDFASANPRNFYPAGPGALVAGSAGVTVGRFAWAVSSLIDPDGGPLVANSFGAGPVTGIVHRDQQGLITTFLADSTMTIPAGFMVTLMVAGDIWIKNEGTTQAVPGQYAYASLATGAANFAATGAASNATATSWSISAQTFSVTASVTNNLMTVTAVGSGTLYPGSVLSAAAANATIVSQQSGTLGGIGVYVVSVPEQTVASTAVTGTYGLLTLTSGITGTFPLGSALSGTAVTAGSTITANSTNGASLTGTGGAGTYVTLTATASAGTLTGTVNVQTKWFAISSGAVGEVVRCSSQVLG